MMDLFRETTFGRLVHLASGGKLFGYDEERDPSLLKKYQPLVSDSSSTSLDIEAKTGSNPEKPAILGDQEKGSDHLLVDWAPNDPHNPRNWSKSKKFFVTFQICLLTVSVYIGSAIYTAGLLGVQEQFNISPVKALLGLTLFVLGYALGPMVWVRRFFPTLLFLACSSVKASL